MTEKPEIDFPESPPPSDLEITDLNEGDGVEATPGANVLAHYVGVAHSTGEEFAASWNRGEPLPFKLGVGQVIVIEAGLSFLGHGVAPPAATWGGLIRDGREIIATAWWMSVFPGLALAITVLAINVLGDRLRAAMGGPQVPAP